MEQVKVGQQVFDFPTPVELDAADDAVLHSLAQAGFLQGAGLGVNPIHHGAAPGLYPFPPGQVAYLLDDKGGLFILGIGLVNHHLRTRRVLRRQFFLHSPTVVGDKTAGGSQDGTGGAIVLLQGDSSGVRVVLLKAEDVADIGVAPGIDGLVRVPHHADVLVRAGEQLGQPVLGDIGVLKLVHHQVPVTPLVLLSHIFVFLEQLHRPHQQVVKVHRVAAGQQFLIVMIDPAGQFLRIAVIQLGLPAQGHRVHQQALGPGDEALHRPGSVALDVNVSQFHRLLDEAQLVVGVVNSVVGVEANPLAVAAEQPGAEGVEGAGKDGVGPLLTVADQGLNSLPHLTRRLVGKGDGGDSVGTDPTFLHQVSNAVGDDPGLAAARPGHNQQRPLGMHHRFRLRVVQPVYQINTLSVHSRPIIARGRVGERGGCHLHRTTAL